MSDNPTNLEALTPKVTGDNGGPFGALLQPKHQVANLATLAATVTSQTTVGANTVAAVNGIIAALVAVGIMKSS